MKNNRRVLIFGRPGSGKTALSVYEMLNALRSGYYVYSNIEIKWFGELFILEGIHKFINKIYFKFFYAIREFRRKMLEKSLDKKYELECLRDNCTYDEFLIPSVNLTRIYYELYWINKKIEKLQNIEDNMKNGWIKPHYYHPSRYRYFDNLKDAITNLTQEALKNPNEKYLLCFDEGFIELDHQRSVPAYITNFFNQSRKLAVDVIISSQRPVAVYPSYRALCDYMIHVEKNWFNRFSSKKYYIDFNKDALPEITKDKDGSEKGERYISWSGKDVFPFFDTRQSIGIKKIKVSYSSSDSRNLPLEIRKQFTL